jgi:hypothetical protein
VYPVRFTVDFPDRPLNRLTSGLRIVAAVPILFVLLWVSGSGLIWSGGGQSAAAGAGGVLFLGPVLMIVFRRKCANHTSATACHRWLEAAMAAAPSSAGAG